MAGKHKCPVCGEYEFDDIGSFDVCEVCGWEDDPLQANNANLKGGANDTSLNEAKDLWVKSKANS